MARPGLPITLLVLASVLICGVAKVGGGAAVGGLVLSSTGGARPDPSTVELRVKINDPESGLSVVATKRIPKGTRGLEAMKGLVVLKSKSYAGMGEFITSFCGVDAPSGKFWALHLDGKLSKLGVDRITLDHDTLIEWKLQDQ